MTKQQFVDRLAEKSGTSRREAVKQTDLFLETLMECLREDKCVKLAGFGKFELKTVREMPARNIWTGEKCIVPEHQKVKFYSSGRLADKVSNE